MWSFSAKPIISEKILRICRKLYLKATGYKKCKQTAAVAVAK